jgi:hypothetical protein
MRTARGWRYSQGKLSQQHQLFSGWGKRCLGLKFASMTALPKLEGVETRKITVQRTFANFDDFWTTSTLSGSVRPTVAALSPGDIELVKSRLRANLPADATGCITYSSFANAVKGRVLE